MRQILWIFTILLTVLSLTLSCSKNDGGEGVHEGEEENGTQFNKNETHNEVLNGVRLMLSYDSNSSSLIGTIENITGNTISQVRNEVHLSNGTELGPTTSVDLTPGETQAVTLSAIGENFETWSAPAEVG
jgi:hypothetical protein